MKTSRQKKSPLWFISFAFFPLALGGFVLGTIDVVKGTRSREWVEVPGVVLSSRLSNSYFAPSQPDVRYSYSFEGQSFVSNRIWAGTVIATMPSLTKAAAQKTVNRFVEGKAVPVFVNPRNPTDVTLIVGPGKAARWMMAFSFFLLIGAITAYAANRTNL